MSDNLKLIGASEEELADPRVQAALAEMDNPKSEAAAAKAICAAVPPPAADAIPLAVNQRGLAKYGLKLRRKTNIHDLFIQRIMSFGVPPGQRWVTEFRANEKTASLELPARIIPETYMPSVFIFVLAAPFALIEQTIELGEQLGFYEFIEKVDEWMATTGIPTDKTAEVWQDIQHSLAFLEKLAAAPDDSPDRPAGESSGPAFKKNEAPGS